MMEFWIRWKQRRRHRVIEDLEEWYSICERIVNLCGDVLHDERLLSRDIGAVLDNIDRTIFHLRDQTPTLNIALRRQFPGMRKQINSTGEKVIRLRNATALFLIHVQGPTPLQRQIPEERRAHYFQRALDRYGFRAQELWEEAKHELTRTRKMLDQMINQWGSNLRKKTR